MWKCGCSVDGTWFVTQAARVLGEIEYDCFKVKAAVLLSAKACDAQVTAELRKSLSYHVDRVMVK